MASDRTVVVGLFRARSDAEEALHALREAGFAGQDVSILAQHPDETLPVDEQAPVTAGATTGAVAGGLLGAVAGWVAGAGSLLIPGVGPFIVAGALASALTGAVLGAGLGAIAGALAGMGIPEEEARWYAQEVKGGSTLVTVKVDGRHADAWAILRKHGAYNVDNRRPEQIGYGVAGSSSDLEQRNA